MTDTTESTTIDVTPTWAEVMPIYLSVLTDPDAPAESKTVAREELMRLARLADRLIAEKSAK